MPTNLTVLREGFYRRWPLVATAILTLGLLQFLLGQLDKGSIRVTTEPSGALVYIDNTQKGIAPTEVGGLEKGVYEVSVSLDGYISERKSVQVESREEVAVAFTLSRTPIESLVTDSRTSDLKLSGDKLYYSKIAAPLIKGLWSYDTKTKQNIRLLGSDRVKTQDVHWAEDGRAIIVDTEGAAWLFSQGQVTKLPFRGYGFSWSPDGTSVAFANDRFFSVKDPEGLSLYNLGSGSVTNIYPDSSVSSRKTSWSPDGSKILYYAYSDEGIGEVNVFSRAGSNRRVVFSQALSEISDLKWSPNSLEIYYSLEGKIYKKEVGKAESTEIADFKHGLLTFDIDSSGIITAGDKVTGEIWRVENASIKSIYQVKDGSLTSVSVNSTEIAVASTKSLLTLSIQK